MAKKKKKKKKKKKRFEAKVTFNLFSKGSRTILTHIKFSLVEIIKSFTSFNYELT